jgi:hypothetical protein
VKDAWRLGEHTADLPLTTNALAREIVAGEVELKNLRAEALRLVEGLDEDS